MATLAHMSVMLELNKRETGPGWMEQARCMVHGSVSLSVSRSLTHSLSLFVSNYDLGPLTPPIWVCCVCVPSDLSRRMRKRAR